MIILTVPSGTLGPSRGISLVVIGTVSLEAPQRPNISPIRDISCPTNPFLIPQRKEMTAIAIIIKSNIDIAVQI